LGAFGKKATQAGGKNRGRRQVERGGTGGPGKKRTIFWLKKSSGWGGGEKEGLSSGPILSEGYWGRRKIKGRGYGSFTPNPKGGVSCRPRAHIRRKREEPTQPAGRISFTILEKKVGEGGASNLWGRNSTVGGKIGKGKRLIPVALASSEFKKRKGRAGWEGRKKR